ncbi:MFS transporter [Streptomyces sp. NPDC059009]|uniref:MFS transporter n=1 Tax=Streptomyces sp. NPDC059009 TaxID=3346694 RepID=UPI0036CC1233
MTLDQAERTAVAATGDTEMSERRRRWALVLLAAALALDVSGVAVINSALPSIGDEFNVSESSLQWTMTAYATAFAGCLLLGGRCADVLGRRKIFAMGIALFALASLGAALAPNLAVLIVARAVQGVGAALSGPASLALLSQIFPEGPARNKAVAVYSATGAASFSGGLVIGGVLTDFIGWRSVFALSVVIGAVVLCAVRALLPAGQRLRQPLDLPGAVLVTAGLGLIVYGVTRGSDIGWTATETVLALALAVVCLIAFVVREKRHSDPLLPLNIFGSSPVRAATLTAAVYYTGVLGLLFFAPLYMQGTLGYSPLESSVAVVPMGVIVAISAQITGRFMTPARYKALMVASLLLIGVGDALWARTDAGSSYWTDMLPGLILMSIGQGVGIGAMTTATLSGLPQHQHGVAGAVQVTAQQLGSSIGVAVLVAVAAGASSQLAGAHAAYLTIGALCVVAALAVVLMRFPRENTSAAADTAAEPVTT